MAGVAAAGTSVPAAKPRWFKQPPRQDKSFAEYFEELKVDGKTDVLCPYGHGVYHMKLTGSRWYDTPEIIFEASKDCPKPFNSPKFGGTTFRMNNGRVIPWYPKWQGVNRHGPFSRAESLRMARMIVWIIRGGRRLYLLRCGDHISSLDDDTYWETRNRGIEPDAWD